MADDAMKFKEAMEAIAAAAEKAKVKGTVVKISPTTISSVVSGQMTATEAVQEQGEYVKGQKPVTAMKIDPFEAARRLRADVKLLATPEKMLGPVNAALSELEAAMAGRSPRKKTQAYEAVLVELETYKTNTKILLKEIKLLAQNIPTQPNLPTTPDENIVRAIIAILKSNGRVNT